MSSAALPRKCCVPRTVSPPGEDPAPAAPGRSRQALVPILPPPDTPIEWPATGSMRQLGLGELLGAAAAVARPPAEVRLGEDHRAQLDDPVHQRLRARRAAGDVDVDRHELVRRHDRVVVEHAHRGRARAHGDGPPRLEHLVVDAPHDRRHLDRDAARQDQQVGLAGGGAERLAAEARHVHARAHERHHLDRAAREPERAREDRVGGGPVAGLLERRREDALLDVLLQLGPLELAVEHLPGRELASAELRLLARPQSLAGHLHSSAPLRHT